MRSAPLMDRNLTKDLEEAHQMKSIMHFPEEYQNLVINNEHRALQLAIELSIAGSQEGESPEQRHQHTYFMQHDPYLQDPNTNFLDVNLNKSPVRNADNFMKSSHNNQLLGERFKKSQNMTECVPVPSSEHVAEIVGRQGCKIKALRAKTNTYIKTPVRGEEPVFVVTGRKEDVNKAKREILSAADHFSIIRATRRPAVEGLTTRVLNGVNKQIPFNASRQSSAQILLPGQVTIKVRVPYRVIGLVVGPKGSTIKHIQQETQTYIVTPTRDKEPVFEVSGLPENVQGAREQIEAHIAFRTGNCKNHSRTGCAALNAGTNYDSSHNKFFQLDPASKQPTNTNRETVSEVAGSNLLSTFCKSGIYSAFDDPLFSTPRALEEEDCGDRYFNSNDSDNITNLTKVYGKHEQGRFLDCEDDRLHDSRNNANKVYNLSEGIISVDMRRRMPKVSVARPNCGLMIHHLDERLNTNYNAACGKHNPLSLLTTVSDNHQQQQSSQNNEIPTICGKYTPNVTFRPSPSSTVLPKWPNANNALGGACSRSSCSSSASPPEIIHNFKNHGEPTDIDEGIDDLHSNFCKLPSTATVNLTKGFGNGEHFSRSKTSSFNSGVHYSSSSISPADSLLSETNSSNNIDNVRSASVPSTSACPVSTASRIALVSAMGSRENLFRQCVICNEKDLFDSAPIPYGYGVACYNCHQNMLIDQVSFPDLKLKSKQWTESLSLRSETEK